MTKLGQTQEVLDLRNTESGRLFFIGSGPSLLQQMDILPRLASERTWAINHYPSWQQRPVTPNFYSISETGHCNRYNIGRFRFPEIGPEMKRFAIHWSLDGRAGWTWVLKTPVDKSLQDGDPFQGLGQKLGPLTGCSNGFLTAMQLACWMGFTEFYFVGNDMTQTGYAWDRQNTRLDFAQAQLERHFWAYEFVRKLVAQDGVTMTDCTPSGALSERGILDYRPLEGILSER